MNADFPRILTLLRKEKGISQKRQRVIWESRRLYFPIMKKAFGNADWISCADGKLLRRFLRLPF